MTHYFLAFEAAAVGIKSSIQWLKKDLMLAHKANLTSILFVHASQGLNGAIQKVLLGKSMAFLLDICIDA